MKRDMDLARKILLEIENAPFGSKKINIQITGYDETDIVYHIKLLSEAGLIEADNLSTLQQLDWRAKSITWQGHDFLDASRNDSNWSKAKDTMKEKGVGLVFDVLKQLLIDIAKRQVFG